MSNAGLRALAGILLLAGSAAGKGATMDITASFSPSMENPENNTFTNTTPQGGFCSNWPGSCADNLFSILLNVNITSNAQQIVVSDADPRDHVYFKLPPLKNIEVTNEAGDKHSVSFSFSHIATKMFNFPSPGSGWGSAPLSNPSGGCSYLMSAWGSAAFYSWVWKVNNPASPAACYKQRTASDVDISSTYMNEIAVGYILSTQSPQTMAGGVYTGTATYTVGPGQDIDFGNKWTPSDTLLQVNFTLTVNHELKLTATADNQAVSLQPCASGRICTADEGAVNWERWMVTRVTPQLTGRSNFSLSSSGAFAVYLQCEQQSGADCALKSDNTPAQSIPVQTLLTLPNNIVDSATGSTVSKRRLAVGRDVANNIFVTRRFGQNQAGSIDFLIGQKDVDTMLKTRPDTYRGAVTVIFDPGLY